jgi:hypothetical protein
MAPPRTLVERIWHAENALVVLIDAFRRAPASEDPERMRRLEHLAELVLRARLQRLKANVAAARGPIAEAKERRAIAAKALCDAQEGGVNAILVEFGVDPMKDQFPG